MKKFIRCLLFLILTISVPAHASLNDGLVGYWTFDNSNDLGHDSSGNNNNGIVTTSDVTYTSNGKINGAAKFVEGITNSAIRVPYSSSLASKNSLTLTAWVNLDGIDPDFGNAIFAKETSSCDPDYDFWVNSHGGGYLLGVSAWVGSAKNINNISTALPNNTWKHVALTYDGNYIKIYVDSILSATTSAVSVLTDNHCDILIGQSPIGGAEDFSGLMDELRIYNRALSSSEIQELYKENAPTNPTTGNAHLINISTRSFVSAGLQNQIAGFAISGGSSLKLVARAIGQGLVEIRSTYLS